MPNFFDRVLAAVAAPPAIPGGNHSIRPFCELYGCLPVVACNKPQLEAGDKIVLPSSALTHLAQLNVQYPMQFSIRNLKNNKTTHCGVMEFSGDEGRCYIPWWMMQELLIEYDDKIQLKNVSLPKGTFVQLQPHQTRFTELHNPRAVLERALRNFSCLTQGDTISIQHGDENFLLNILEVKPGKAISIIETDVNVDFAPPLDLAQHQAKQAQTAKSKQISSSTSTSSHKPVTASASLNHEASAIVAGDFTFHGHQADEQKSMFDSKSHHLVESADKIKSQQTATTSSSSASSYFANLTGGRTLSGKVRNGSKTGTPLQSGSSSPKTHSPKNLSNVNSGTGSIKAQSASSNTTTTTTTTVAPSQVTEVAGNWAYVYSIDEKGNKKLLRREAKEKYEARLKGAANTPFAGKGHSLK
jgi:ubiquitin fusion degradation protein 1